MNAPYDNLRADCALGNLDWTADNIKVTLVDETYTYDATHTDLADLGASVVAGITDQAIANIAVDDVGFVTGDSVTIPGATTGQTVQAVIVYVDRGGGLTELLWFFDTGVGFPLTTTGADVAVDWNATAGNGIIFKVG